MLDQLLSATTLISSAIGALLATLAAEFIKSLVRRTQLAETQRDIDLADILNCIIDINATAEKYWLKSAAELGADRYVMEAQIRAKLHHTAKLIAGLFSAPLKYECDTAHHKLMDAVSGGNFGEPDREPMPERLTHVSVTAMDLRHIVSTQRRKLKRGVLA